MGGMCIKRKEKKLEGRTGIEITTATELRRLKCFGQSMISVETITNRMMFTNISYDGSLYPRVTHSVPVSHRCIFIFPRKPIGKTSEYHFTCCHNNHSCLSIVSAYCRWVLFPFSLVSVIFGHSNKVSVKPLCWSPPADPFWVAAGTPLSRHDSWSGNCYVHARQLLFRPWTSSSLGLTRSFGLCRLAPSI